MFTLTLMFDTFMYVFVQKQEMFQIPYTEQCCKTNDFNFQFKLKCFVLFRFSAKSIYDDDNTLSSEEDILREVNSCKSDKESKK